MKILLIIISLFSLNSCKSLINEKILTDKYWGQINDRIPSHRGKTGLIIMKLNSNYTFSAFENTDFGASILQKGKWSIKNNNIIFDVLETKNYAEHTKMKGKILSNKEIGKIKYEVKELTTEKLILFNKKQEEELIFELSKYKYGI